jgi:CBS domain-containing protein
MSQHTTRVFDIMTRDPITVPGSAPLSEARRRLENGHITGLPVTDGADRVIGVISQTDFLALSRHDDDGPIGRNGGRRVSDAVARPALTIGAWAPVRAAARLLLDYGVHRLVVVDEEERAVGILTTTDFVRLVADQPA